MRRHALFIVLMLMALSGCGGSSVAPNEAGVVDLSSALANTQAAESARIQMRISMDVGAQSMEMEGEGITQLDGSRAQFTMSGVGESASLLPEGTIIIIDGMQYLSGGMALQHTMTGLAPSSAEWVATPLPDFVATQPGMSDIGALFDMLEQADADVNELGSTQLDGETVEHVSSTVNIAAAMEASGMDVKDILAQQPGVDQMSDTPEFQRMLAAMDDLVYTFDVWYSPHDGLVRRMEMAADLTPMMEAAMGATGGQDMSSSMTMRMDFSDFGVDVDVVAPTEGVHTIG